LAAEDSGGFFPVSTAIVSSLVVQVPALITVFELAGSAVAL
jgi:hypothetical protein